jgi:hypothetical protein
VADRTRTRRDPLREGGHDDHDAFLVAALAAGDLDGDELRSATRQVAECGSCAELAADLRSIASATATLPPARRTRDYTISTDQAAKLRRGGWRGLVAAITAPRSVLAPRLAATLTTLGVAGLLLASVPGIALNGGAATGPEGTHQDRMTLSEQASPAAQGPGQQPGEEEPPGQPEPQGQGQPGDAAGEPKSLRTDEVGSRAVDRLPLVVLSAVLLASGLAIFAVRRTTPGRSGR